MAAKLFKEQQKSFGNNVKYFDFIDGKYFLKHQRLKEPLGTVQRKLRLVKYFADIFN